MTNSKTIIDKGVEFEPFIKQIDDAIKSKSLFYCIQCFDNESSEIGDFIHNGNKRAIGPVFKNLSDLYDYMNQIGLERKPMTSFELQRIV